MVMVNGLILKGFL